MTVKFNVVNMSCANCQKHVKHALEELSGIKDIEINLPAKEVVVDFDENQVTPNQMIDAMAEVNYQANII